MQIWDLAVLFRGEKREKKKNGRRETPATGSALARNGLILET